MTINLKRASKKALTLLLSAIILTTLLICGQFLFHFFTTLDFERAIHKIKPIKLSTVVFLYGLLPAIPAIAILEYKKSSKGIYYALGSLACALIYASILYYIEISEPPIEATKTPELTPFGYITAHPRSTPTNDESVILTAGFLSMAVASLYWLLAVKKKK